MIQKSQTLLKKRVKIKSVCFSVGNLDNFETLEENLYQISPPEPIAILD